jgi:hypothetical protein
MLCAACLVVRARSPHEIDPRAAVEELLRADRHFATRARTGAIEAIASMLADDATLPTRTHFARGREAAVAALSRTFGLAAARAEWSPVRGGLSADGLHGFTFGYMTIAKPDSSRTPLKYLSYWVREPAGWRVVAYRVGRRAAGDVSLAMIEPSLPPRLVPPTSDVATIARHSESLIAAERGFSDRAQEIGLGPAFEERGSADAVNMGGADSPTFIVGSRAIGRAVSGGATGPPSPVVWGADRAIVASSGDLGVTFGLIRPNARPAAGGHGAGLPFFTIWRRQRLTDPWRYVAE